MINDTIDPRFLNDLYLFYRLFVTQPKFKTDAKPAHHIKELSRHLMAMSLGKLNKYLAVSMPPRHSKSSMITIAYPLWRIFQDPDRNILIITNTKELAEKFGIELRELIIKFGYLFNVYLSDVKHSSSHLKFCDKNGNLYNGSIRLTGASGSITGQDADDIIVDDPYKGEEDEFTPTALQKKIDWFKRVIIQRIEPHTNLLVLHTRWHSNDLIGYFQKKLDHLFKFITFQAIKDDGTPLWPEQYNIKSLTDKLETVGERLFSSIWQQKPLDDTSNFFDLDSISYKGLRPDEKIIYTCRAWDVSKGATLKADYTAGALMVKTDQDRIGLIELIYGQFSNETKSTIFGATEKDGFDVNPIFETGVAAAGDLLFDEWKSQLPGYRVKRAPTITSKPDRATPLKNGILDHKFFIDIKDPELVETINSELKSFPDGVHDDITDAIAHGYNFLKNKKPRPSFKVF